MHLSGRRPDGEKPILYTLVLSQTSSRRSPSWSLVQRPHQHAAIRYWSGHCLPLCDRAPAYAASGQQHKWIRCEFHRAAGPIPAAAPLSVAAKQMAPVWN